MFLLGTAHTLPAAYAPLAAYIAPARARGALWRIGATLAMMILGFIILTQAALTLVNALANAVVGPFWAEAIWRTMEGGRSALGVIAVLAGFLPLAIGLALAVRVLHDRRWTTLLGPAKLTWRSMLWVGGGLVLLQAVLMPIQIAAPEAGRHLTFAQQLPWLVPALLGILIQASTEEALFRGYLLQQLAVRTLSPLVWMGLPALLFAALHLDPSAGAADMIWSGGAAFMFSLAAADLTARSGTLGPAIGLHAASNIGGILMVGMYGKMDGLAAWNLVLGPSQPWASLPYMAVDAVGLLVSWLLARLILRV